MCLKWQPEGSGIYSLKETYYFNFQMSTFVRKKVPDTNFICVSVHVPYGDSQTAFGSLTAWVIWKSSKWS